MSDQETEMEWFGDDERKKPTGGGNTPSKKEPNHASNSKINTMGNDGYQVVHRDEGEAKGASGEIIIETAVKGLLYRCEVFKGGTLIDAREIDCKDLLSNAEKDYIFKQRYMATHNTFKMQYIAEEFFKEVESTEGDFKDGDEEHCKVVTSVSDDTIRTIIYVDGEEFETQEIAILENIKNKKSLLEKKCQTFHLKSVLEYIDTEKFPVNTFLNPVLEKLPFYKKNPMHSFYLFLGLLGVLFMAAYFTYGMYLNTLKDGKLKKKKFSESIWHTLENRCMESKERGWPKEAKPTFKKCTNFYYKDRLFSQEAYDRIFGDIDWDKKAAECKASATNAWKDEKGKELKEMCEPLCKDGTIPETSCIPNVAKYNVTPKELTLSLYDSQPIHLTNKASDELFVEIEDIMMDDTSKPEEIIYIVNRNRERTVGGRSEDEFRIRLEHSAIKDNFDSGVEYTGTIKLKLTYDGKEDHEDIRFKFKLNL